MTYHGHVENGMVVLDTPADLPDGTRVTVAALDLQPEANGSKSISEIIAEMGASLPPEAWEGVPEDGAGNLDHYLYGAPRKDTEEESEHARVTQDYCS